MEEKRWNCIEHRSIKRYVTLCLKLNARIHLFSDLQICKKLSFKVNLKDIMESQGIKHRAVYQYTASREDELNLKVGDIIDQVVD